MGARALCPSWGAANSSLRGRNDCQGDGLRVGVERLSFSNLSRYDFKNAVCDTFRSTDMLAACVCPRLG